MNTRLISITPDCENIIMYCARVSNPKNQNSGNIKLLEYCTQNQHWSIFEMGNMIIEIETSRAIAQQIIRHKSFSIQEFSQRYQQVTEFEQYEARRQDPKDRQNSIDDMSVDDKDWFKRAQEKIQHEAFCFYKEALDRNIAKEQARFLLPLSTKTKLYINGTIRSWIHFLDVRCQNSTQREHRDVADSIKRIFIEQLPNIAKVKGWS